MFKSKTILRISNCFNDTTNNARKKKAAEIRLRQGVNEKEDLNVERSSEEEHAYKQSKWHVSTPISDEYSQLGKRSTYIHDGPPRLQDISPRSQDPSLGLDFSGSAETGNGTHSLDKEVTNTATGNERPALPETDRITDPKSTPESLRNASRYEHHYQAFNSENPVDEFRETFRSDENTQVFKPGEKEDEVVQEVSECHQAASDENTVDPLSGEVPHDEYRQLLSPGATLDATLTPHHESTYSSDEDHLSIMQPEHSSSSQSSASHLESSRPAHTMYLPIAKIRRPIVIPTELTDDDSSSVEDDPWRCSSSMVPNTGDLQDPYQIDIMREDISPWASCTSLKDCATTHCFDGASEDTAIESSVQFTEGAHVKRSCQLGHAYYGASPYLSAKTIRALLKRLAIPSAATLRYYTNEWAKHVDKADSVEAEGNPPVARSSSPGVQIQYIPKAITPLKQRPTSNTTSGSGNRIRSSRATSVDASAQQYPSRSGTTTPLAGGGTQPSRLTQRNSRLPMLNTGSIPGQWQPSPSRNQQQHHHLSRQTSYSSNVSAAYTSPTMRANNAYHSHNPSQHTMLPDSERDDMTLAELKSQIHGHRRSSSAHSPTSPTSPLQSYSPSLNDRSPSLHSNRYSQARYGGYLPPSSPPITGTRMTSSPPQQDFSYRQSQLHSTFHSQNPNSRRSISDPARSPASIEAKNRIDMDNHLLRKREEMLAVKAQRADYSEGLKDGRSRIEREMDGLADTAPEVLEDMHRIGMRKIMRGVWVGEGGR